MPDSPLDASAVEDRRARTRGPIFRPGDEGYDGARSVWNGMIDHRPAGVVRCTGAADVRAAVDFARQRELPVSAKGGGHSVAGRAVCDGGVALDLSPMNDVRVDPEARTARVGPGATWGDFDHEAQAFGLATTGGLDSRTGVAGLTLGGGIGYLARTYGLALDNLISADVVTADGELVRASEGENPDLFWALRGAGANFGVVTSFEFELHPVGPEVMVAQVFHPSGRAKEVFRLYRDFMAGAPEEAACYALVANVPPEPPFPEKYHGETTAALVACYSGPVEEGREALEPLLGLDDPILEVLGPMPYTALQQTFDDGTPDGGRYYFKSCYLEGLPDDAIDTIVTHAESLPGPFTMTGLEPMGGAINRVEADATAHPHRNAAYTFGAWAGWSDPADDDEAIAWTRDFHAAMEPFSTGGVYVNYLDRDDDERIGAAYGINHDRLIELKAEWDPENLFRSNSNIRPAVTT